MPNVRSAAYGQLWVCSPCVRHLFGAMHSLCIRVRKIRRRNDEEVCSSVPSMCGYVRGGRESGANSAGRCIRRKYELHCSEVTSGQNGAYRGWARRVGRNHKPCTRRTSGMPNDRQKQPRSSLTGDFMSTSNITSKIGAVFYIIWACLCDRYLLH